MARVLPPGPATADQVKTLVALADERQIAKRDAQRIAKLSTAGLTTVEARVLISKLLKKERRPDLPPLTEGVYALDDRFYKVRISQQSGHPYALELWLENGEPKHKYARGVVFMLRAEHRLSPSQLAKAGLK